MTRPTTAVARRKTAARAAATRKVRARRVPPPTALESATAMVSGAVEAMIRLLPWARDEADPIALLEADHRRFEALFERGAATTARAVKTRASVLASLTAELNVHELIEEQVLYPALASVKAARAIVLEGSQEHHVADVLLKELHRMSKGDERWGAKFKVLQESIAHHIEEEERRMFPIARGSLDRKALHALGVRMRELRKANGG
jgi:hemerythrin-like domain-containing protein